MAEKPIKTAWIHYLSTKNKNIYQMATKILNIIEMKLRVPKRDFKQREL